jgi:hypothetical protein
MYMHCFGLLKADILTQIIPKNFLPIQIRPCEEDKQTKIMLSTV